MTNKTKLLGKPKKPSNVTVKSVKGRFTYRIAQGGVVKSYSTSASSSEIMSAAVKEYRQALKRLADS